MRTRKWISIFTAAAFAAITCLGAVKANADGHGKDKHHGRDDDEDRDHYGHYYDHDRDYVRDWYRDRDRDQGLPPGLAKKDRLPPGLEKQLILRGTLPPGLQKKVYPAPMDVVRRLPPPPPDCENVVIGGHFVLLNRKTNIVVDIFHFER